MSRIWPTLSSRVLHDFRIFQLRIDRCVSPRTGVAHDFYVLQSDPWVNIIPLTADGQVVMVRQYRFGTRQVTLEIPGGVVDPGEDPRAAAVRELREESGYEAEQVLGLGEIAPNPAIHDTRCFTFLAQGCRLMGAPEPDEKEDLGVETVPLADIPRLLAEGAITHALVAVAFQKLDLWQRGYLKAA